MPNIAGLRGTGDFATDERPKNFREMILWRNPNGQAPLTALMAKMKKESVDDAEFSWFEEEQNAVRVTSDATGLSATSTTLTVVSGALALVAGDNLLVEKTETATYDNEIVTVSSVTSDTVLVVKRGQAGTTAAATGVSANFTNLGSAFEEGSVSPTITNSNPSKILNYTQIFKDKFGVTRTAQNTKLRTGDALKNDKQRKMFQHSVKMEMQWLYGVPYEDLTGTKPKRFTGGLRNFITTNVTIFTTTPTETTTLNALYPVFNYQGGSAGDERIVFAGNGALNSLNKLAKDSSSTRINFDGVVKTFGMSLQQWVTPQGVFYIKSHPLMNNHPRFTNSMFVIDPSVLIYRPLAGSDTKIKNNVQANDADAREDMWLTEAGMEIQHEKLFAYIGNFVVP